MWLQRSEIHYLANESGSPLLVKFDDQVSYLPVFETKKEAIFAAQRLAATYAEAVQETGQIYSPRPFTWAAFQAAQEHAKHLGHTLFVYPMSPQEYGRTFQTHAA